MMATPSTPRLELVKTLIAAAVEIDRLGARLAGLGRGLVGAHRHLARPAARPALGDAYLRRAEEEYEVALGRLHAAYRDAQALGSLG